MRTKEMLRTGFEELQKLYRYLYFKEGNNVVIKNVIGVPLELTMNEDEVIMCRNLNFPESEPTPFTGQDIPTMMAVIDQLKETPPRNKNGVFKSRWDEVVVEQAMAIVMLDQ